MHPEIGQDSWHCNLGIAVFWIAILNSPSPTMARINPLTGTHLWTPTVGTVLAKESEETGYLTAQCHAMLLILGGVETNPGPTQEKQQEVIEALVSTAREDEVKDVLRSYNPTHTHKQQVRDISKHNLNKLKGAALFLKMEGSQTLLKPALVQAVIVRIQNLLPDKCQICDEEYTVLLEEKPLLGCSICGQGAHGRCISQFVDNVEEPVLKIPGTHWICGACEGNVIPKETGRVQSRNLPARDTDREDEDTEQAQEELPGSQASADEDGEQNQGARDRANTAPRDPQPVCSHYKKGTCRHGISGRGCRFQHPKPCQKLMNHGT